MASEPIALTPVVQVPLATLYEEVKELGRGVNAQRVVLGRHKITGGLRALKIFPKSDGITMKVLHEKEILRRSAHPNIVKVHEIIEDAEYVTLALEYVEYGDLLNWMSTKGEVTEYDVCTIIRQVLGALQYLHDNNIVHRDMKPDNILVRRLDPLEVVLCDFGLSKLCVCEAGMFTPAGPGINYMAPDILRALMGNMSAQEVGPLLATRNEAKGWEVWSVGVLTYYLLSGTLPFRGGTVTAQLDVIDSGVLRFPPAHFSTVSDEAKDFVTSLLNPDICCRARDTSTAMSHPWFAKLVDTDAHSSKNSTPLSTPMVLMSVSREQVLQEFEQVSPPLIPEVSVDVNLNNTSETAGPCGDRIRVVTAAARPNVQVDQSAVIRKMMERQKQVSQKCQEREKS
jgi:serine/threonine protein kinase